MSAHATLPYRPVIVPQPEQDHNLCAGTATGCNTHGPLQACDGQSRVGRPMRHADGWVKRSQQHHTLVPQSSTPGPVMPAMPVTVGATAGLSNSAPGEAVRLLLL